ncbi:MAG: NUDIX hydrolase, partial [Candidatus Aminicenantaceae bacterium]
ADLNRGRMNDTDWIYNQSGVVPFRLEKGKAQILLITSRSGKRWVIPKGIIEPDLSPIESAQKEAYEEAGVSGKICGKAVGTYTYNKWGGTCTVKVFLLKVEETIEDWPESYFRTREWMSVEEAVKRIDEAKLKEIINKLPIIHI